MGILILANVANIMNAWTPIVLDVSQESIDDLEAAGIPEHAER